MNSLIMKKTDLPKDVQAIIEKYNYRGNEVRVIPTIDFKCPTNWHDCNLMHLVVYNQKTGEHKMQASGYYDSYANFSKEERAMYHGELKSTIPDSSIWILLIETYPKSCRVYCHPTAMALAIEKPKLELTRRQLICLYITRAYKSAYRISEARLYKISRADWFMTINELYSLGLMTKTGALTIDGKNQAQNLNYNYWEVENEQN